MIRQLPEKVTDLIVKHLRDNMSTSMAALRTDRTDSHITSETPLKYYINEQDNYTSPAIFVLVQDVDFMKETRGANYINAEMSLNVHIIVEETKEEEVTRKSFRYLAVVQSLLDQATLTDNSKIKFELVTKRAEFSPVLIDSNIGRKDFKKEVILTCVAYCFESF
jgi:hypothetical protein